MTFSPFSRRTVLAAAAILGPVLRGSAAEVDPVFAAIQAAEDAEVAFTASLVGLDENDLVAMHRANEAADRSSDAINALAKVRPTTTGGLHALIQHYADDSALNDPNSLGALALYHLARVIRPPPPS